MSVDMYMWVIEFRHISPQDYHTPMMYLPIQSTLIAAINKKEAQFKFYESLSLFPSSELVIKEIYKHPWMKPLTGKEEKK